MKRLIVSWLIATFSVMVTFNANATTITVEPGYDTLRAAVNAASAGDILVLKDGIYPLSRTSALVIDKSLTIRSINASANPQIYFSTVTGSTGNPRIEIEGTGTEFILQGATYYYSRYGGEFDIKGEIQSAALLENTFSGIRVSATQTFDQDNNVSTAKQVLMVGNSFFSNVYSSGSLYNLGAEETFLFAGNRVTNQQLHTADYGADNHIIGNVFNYSSTMLSIHNSNYSRVVGNTFNQRLSDQTNVTVSKSTYPELIHVHGRGEILNNIFRTGLNPYNATGTPSNYQFVRFEGTKWTVANNVFEQSRTERHADAADDYPTFEVYTELNFKNNIITGDLQPILFDYNSNAAALNFSEVSNNLCFNTEVDCPADNGNLSNTDPKFVDTTNYILATGSPAIDAGLASDVFRDIDGSITDMGPQGGIFPISEFISQLQAGVTTPYLYPLFEANSSLSNTGELTVKAVAIARHR